MTKQEGGYSMRTFGFDQQNNNLWLDSIDLALKIEQRFKQIVSIAEEINQAEIQNIIASDDEIDLLHEKIEKRVLELIILGLIDPQELQKLIGILKLARELERIADYLVDIAEIACAYTRLAGLELLLKSAFAQYKKVLEILMTKDINKAVQIDACDDELDQIYQDFKLDIKRQPALEISQIADCLLIARYLERIGDHAVNMAEILIFILTGRIRYFHKQGGGN